jgi:hypothetical protein
MNGIIYLLNIFSNRTLITLRRPGRALKQMESLPNFSKELQKYIYKTIQKEAEGVKVEKEIAPGEFNRETLRSFSYQSYHERSAGHHTAAQCCNNWCSEQPII